MKISKYILYFFRDFFAVFGFLIMIVMIFLAIYSKGTINASLLWQIAIAASAFTFFKFALANDYELEKKVQTISFYICFLLADMSLLMWLLFFSPGKVVDINLIVIYTIIVILVKGAVYIMMYVDGQTQAKKLNEKLRKYNTDNE